MRERKSVARQAKIMIVVKPNDTLALDILPASGKKYFTKFKIQFSLTSKQKNMFQHKHPFLLE